MRSVTFYRILPWIVATGSVETAPLDLIRRKKRPIQPQRTKDIFVGESLSRVRGKHGLIAPAALPGHRWEIVRSEFFRKGLKYAARNSF
jgi:hypothetical protein